MSKERDRTIFKRQTVHEFVGGFTYDTEADAGYLYLGNSGDSKVAVTQRCKGRRDVYLDFDEQGRLIGIELLGRDLLAPDLIEALKVTSE
jgi:uncharacterized protein YuzE